MGKVIITIGREYGSGGRFIGKMVAEKLKIPFYDKELIALAARDGNINEKVIENLDETASNRFFYAMPTNSFMPSTVSTSFDMTMNDRLFLVQSKAIKQIADEGSAVIVGRCADYVLRGNPDVINVFIHADLEHRVEHAIKYYGLNPLIAKKTIQKTDETRMKYYNYYTSHKWGIANNYTLCIDSSLGLETATGIIALAALTKLK
ncbi:MAG: cytidylate kinase-like family protein [Clostridia bacterium]